jgi:predicted DNA-binding protein YlxM (UPF0122 family)
MSSYLKWATTVNQLTKKQKKILKEYFYIDIDLAFQSRARWSKSDKEKFINSCLVDMNISKYVLVDVERCRDASHKGSDDWKYYDSWLQKGVYYLNVDSNNRTTTLREFANDKVSIPLGDYFINGVTYTVTKDTNLFSTMNEDLKQIFLANRSSVHIVVDATREQLSDIFMRMNSGVGLNFEEQINCSYSTTCEVIRELVDIQWESLYKAKLFSQNEIDRRKIDGWFANISHIWCQNFSKGWTPTEHRTWYSSESVSNKSIHTFVNDWNNFIKLIGNKVKLFHHKWVLFDLFYQIVKQQRDHKELLDENVVIDFIEMYTNLVVDKTPKYSYDEIITNESILFPFKQFTRGGDVNNFNARDRVYQSTGWDISKYFSQSNPKDSTRGFKRIEKQAIAVRDNWKDNDGDMFEPESLFDGNLDAGHIIAHNKQGKTVLSNGVIEKMTKNRGKGDEETVVTK